MYREFFPALTFLVRDFQLKLEDSAGRSIDSYTYLMNALAPLKKNPANARKNEIREDIKDSFPDLNCNTLCRPVGVDVDITKLHELPFTSLLPKF